MSTLDFDQIAEAISPEQRHQAKERCVRRLARGWQVAIRLHERLRRRDEGRPLSELMKNDSSVRARESE